MKSLFEKNCVQVGRLATRGETLLPAPAATRWCHTAGKATTKTWRGRSPSTKHGGPITRSCPSAATGSRRKVMHFILFDWPRRAGLANARALFGKKWCGLPTLQDQNERQKLPCSVRFLSTVKKIKDASRPHKDTPSKFTLLVSHFAVYTLVQIWHACGGPWSVGSPVRPNMFEHSLTRPCIHEVQWRH